MMQRLRKMVDTARIRDSIRVSVSEKGKKINGRLVMPDGSPVTTEHIMEVWSVSREYAEAFVKRVNA